MPVTDKTYERRRYAAKMGHRMRKPVYRLMHYRIRAGLTRHQLADAVGVAYSTVYNLEHGTWAQWATRELLAAALGVEVRELEGDA